jgi:PAS domain S-box-containing protein
LNKDFNYLDEKPALEEIIEHYFEAIFVADSNGQVMLANPAAASILGIPLDKLIGANVSHLVSEGYYDRSTVLEVIKTKKSVMEVLNTKHGKKIVSNSHPLFDDNGNIVMVLSTGVERDIIREFTTTLEREREAKDKYRNEVEYLRDRNLEKDKIVAKSSLMRNVLLQANKIAATDSTVMLYGESGTGKEVIAKYVHRYSHRKNAAFVTVNCAAIPDNLLESELFGYEKGAFTGASNKGKPGLFEIADKGTLFLDEIAELPLFLQPKLLRVIENGEVRKIGATNDKKVDVRLIGATNKNLKKMIADNTFREDLFYRLNVIPITLPPLRNRPEDIVALAEMFLQEYNIKYRFNKYFGPGIVNDLLHYNWPGNVRELKNIIERLFLTTQGDEINSYETGITMPVKENIVKRPEGVDIGKSQYSGNLKEVLGQVEKQYIEQVIQECNGSINEAAQKLGIHRSVLFRKRKGHDDANKQHVVE